MSARDVLTGLVERLNTEGGGSPYGISGLPILLDNYRAEVMQEAARIALSLRQFEQCTGARGAAQVSENVGILRVADALAAEGKGTGTTGGEPTPPAGFFRVGTAYRSEAGRFQCHVVTHHPMTGERRALGWMFRQVDGVLQWVVTQLDPDDYAVGGWTETGGGR